MPSPFFHKWDLCQSKLFLPQKQPRVQKKNKNQNKKTPEREASLLYFPCNSSQTSELLAFLGSHVAFSTLHLLRSCRRASKAARSRPSPGGRRPLRHRPSPAPATSALSDRVCSRRSLLAKYDGDSEEERRPEDDQKRSWRTR